MIAWPHDLTTAIARRRSVLFLGAGVSMNAQNLAGDRPPSWEQFLQRGIDLCAGNKRLLQRLLRNGDYLTCCHILKNTLNNRWIGLVEDCFLHPNYLPKEIHSAIFRLDSGTVLTPNFDKIYDSHAQNMDPNRVKVKRYHDDDVGRVVRGGEKQRLILKIHGCIDTPNKLIFTREDYAKARVKNSSFYSIVDALLLTHTFIFIGCGMTDPDLLLLLEQYSYSFEAAPSHYLLMPGPISREYRELFRTNYNIEVIAYSKKDDHKELTDSLEELVGLVDVRRDELAGEQLW